MVATEPVVHGTDQKAHMRDRAAAMDIADLPVRVAAVATGAGPSEECYFELNSRRPSSSPVQHCCQSMTLQHHELHLSED